jgi:ABC-type Zn uptake system ZnuABC Zn-binding protein ZnuA
MYLILAIFLSFPSFASITCTHPQVCNLFENSNYPFKLEIDPHHFEPSIGEIKTLLSADTVAFGPSDLNPWAQKIEINRKNSNKKNIVIEIPEEFKKKYGEKNIHMIEHFWLYPDILCSLVKDCKTKDGEQKIKNLKNLVHGKYFVLTHDALAPLFESQGAIVTSLRTSTHNCEAQPQSLKILEQWRKENRRPIWLIEENVHTFQQLKGKIGKEDLVVKIDIIGRPGENPFAVFDKIYLDLEKVLHGKSNP